MTHFSVIYYPNLYPSGGGNLEIQMIDHNGRESCKHVINNILPEHIENQAKYQIVVSLKQFVQSTIDWRKQAVQYGVGRYIQNDRALTKAMGLLHQTQNIEQFSEVLNKSVFDLLTKICPSEPGTSRNAFIRRLRLIADTLKETESGIKIIQQPSLFPVEISEPNSACFS